MTEHSLGFVEVGQDLHAALVIGLAVGRGPHVARRAFQQARAEPRFQYLDGVGGGGARNAKHVGGATKAVLLDDAGEEPPLGRIGEPDEIAAAVAFLAGPDGAWVNAQVVRVNGGYA